MTQEVIAAINEYVHNDVCQISMRHHWEDVRTFTRYFERAQKHKEHWRTTLQENIISLGGTIPPVSIGEKIDDNVLPSGLILKLRSLRHEKLGVEIMTLEDGRLWFLAMLSADKKGLGPP